VLRTLHSLWPRGLRLGDAVPDVSEAIDDLRLLQRNGMIELRLIDSCDLKVDPEPLKRMERQWGDYMTTPDHGVQRTGPESSIADADI
jgi:hypothetical protein